MFSALLSSILYSFLCGILAILAKFAIQNKSMGASKYNFDEIIDRRGSDATKYEELEVKYGRKDLLPLWIADMDFAVSPCITDALRRRLDHPVLGYTEAPAAFWQSICSWLGRRHGWEVSREEIDYVPGLKKGIGLCVNYFTSPGDKVVIQPPVYHSFRSVVESNFRVPVTNPLKLNEDGSYSMDFDGLEALVALERPKMMIVCNPHNPIGLQWSEDDLRRVADICYRNSMVLLSDEIYADLMLGGRRHVPTASVSPQAEAVTVTLGAPSKSFNIPGLASAWVVVKSPELRRGFFDWLTGSEFNTPPLPAIIATMAAYNGCEDWLDEVLAYLDANASYAIGRLAEALPAVSAFHPQAGFGLWIDFRGLGLGNECLEDLLVNEARVAVSDGASFGKEGSEFVRLNIGVPRAVLDEGLTRICKALSCR